MPRLAGWLFCLGFVVLAVCSAPLNADPTDDQYSIAAGLYARKQWDLAIDEFRAFLAANPDHAKAAKATFYLAEALVQLRDFAAARDAFQSFLERDPDNAQARQAQFRLGEIDHLLGRDAEASQELSDFIAQNPDDPLTAFALPYLGEIRLAQSDLTAAQTFFEDALRLYPTGKMADECRFGIGRVHQLAGRRAEAEELFAPLAKQESHRLADDAAFQLAALKYEAGQYDQALAAFSRFTEQFPKSSLVDRAQLTSGWCHFHLGQLDEAERQFKSLGDHEQLGAEAQYWLGLALSKKREWPAAIAALESSLNRHPNSELEPAVRFQLGEALRQTQNAAGAEAQFASVIEHFPNSSWAEKCLVGQVQLASAAQEHANVEKLAASYREVFENGKQRADVERAVVRSLLAQKRFTDAQQHLELVRRIQAAPGGDSIAASLGISSQDRYLLALALHGQGLYEEALGELTAAISAGDLGALTPDVQFAQAMALIALEKYADAIAPLEAYLTAQPQGENAALCRARLPLCYARSNRLEEAQSSYELFRQQVADPKLIWPATDNLAEALFAAQHYEQAERLYASLATESNDPALQAQGWFGQAHCHWQQEEFDEAEAAFRHFLDHYPDDGRIVAAKLARARLLERLQNVDAALVAYKKVAEEHPQSTETAPALVAAARIHDRLSQKREAEEIYRQIWDAYPQLADRDTLLYDWAWVLSDLNKPAEAEERFALLNRDFRASPLWSDATYRLAEMAIQRNDSDRARELLTAITSSAALIDNQTSESAKQKADSVRAHALFLRGQLEASLKQWSECVAPLEQLVQEFPQHPRRLRADFWLAEAKYHLGDYDSASQRFDALALALGDSKETWVPQVALRRAQILAHGQRWADCQVLAEQIPAQFPEFERQFEVDYLIGRALYEQALLDDARSAFTRVIQSAQGARTETAAMAQFMIGECYLHQKNYKAALREYLGLDILYDIPEWQAAALLEAGTCYENLNQITQAGQTYTRLAKTFPDTKYATDAVERLKALSAAKTDSETATKN